MTNYELTSPIGTVEFTANLSRWEWGAILAAWLVVNVAVIVALLWAYAVPFAGWVGFETAALVGIGLIAFNTGGPP